MSGAVTLSSLPDELIGMILNATSLDIRDLVVYVEADKRQTKSDQDETNIS